jgi:small subunit ribosomal protein S9
MFNIKRIIIMAPKSDEIWATGRRKAAVARVRMSAGSGQIIVNGRKFEEYFPSEAVRGFICQTLTVTDNLNSVDIKANIKGGGLVGQAGALRHGIARALAKQDESLRSVLKGCGMLSRDARVKERKKPGQPGARKRFQFSKR